MRSVTLLFLTFFGFSVVYSQKEQVPAQTSGRIEKLINSNWTFNYFPEEKADEGYESAAYDDSKWPVVSIPHTWMTFETTGESDPYIKNTKEDENPYWWTGWGWYRKHFSVNSEFSGKKIFIEFEGVQKYCKIWLNGKYIGDHKGGYTSFSFDLTGSLIPGKDNVLVLAVNNSQNDQFGIPPMTANKFNVYGGIYRSVTLVVKDKLYIPFQGSAVQEGGTFVTTPSVSEKEGTVRIQTWIKNDHPQPKECVLNTYIIDGSGKILQVLTSGSTINPGQLYMFDQTSKPVRNPRLWSDEDPYLYKIRSEVVDGKIITDSYISPLGFRWYRWDCKENAFYLNGKRKTLKCALRVQEYPWLGDAIPDWINQMDFKFIAEDLDFNFVRTAYFPWTKQVYDLTDMYGIIVCEESPGIGSKELSAEITEKQLTEMIRRDRNHPSVIFLSAGDEKSYTATSKTIKTEDPTRILITRHLPDYSSSDFITSAEGAGLCTVNFNETVIDNRTLYAFSEIAAASDQAAAKGEPARIILSGSHKKIPADRGSVVTLTVNIADTKGNLIYDAGNNIKWIVTGPATLLGPAAFISETHRKLAPDGFTYTGLPVTNVIRSTGKPGNIIVTALASGLASDSYEIVAEETVADNSVISESVLSDEGRKPVAKAMPVFERLEDLPREIRISGMEINAGASDKKGYEGFIRKYIMENNASADTSTIEFKTLIDLLSHHLVKNNGRLSAVDYNFSVDHFNNCRLIAGYIDATKLPLLFKEGLKEYYADVIIQSGVEKNAGDEMNWMNWIPSGGTVVISQEGTSTSWPKGTIVSASNELPDLIAGVYPVFRNYSAEAKERALTFISKVNPYIITAIAGEKVRYTAERGKPILIPLIKFFSE
ncbi:MAG: beta galactosidase jelly roll domain-containing protein [Bacteroidales bacterium]|nr:beta galactosidase jelly roll domain-containing protein [Bacteroidales bacterium]